MPNLKIYWSAKNFLWKGSQLVHMVLKELLKGIDCQMTLRTDHFVDLTFQGSNQSPTEQLAVKDC